MPKEIELKSQQLITLHKLLIMYLVWFFLTGFFEMTKQLVFEASPFLTQGIHYMFFITTRLIFIPIVIYFIIYRNSLSLESIGLTKKNFFSMVKVGIKISFITIPMILFLVHLPLVNSNIHLHPMIKATSPEEIAISLVYFIFIFFMTFIPALSEELLFRGLTFPFLKERVGTWQALLLNAVLYAIFYLSFNPYMITLRIILGFFTTYLFWRSKNLIPSTILQAFIHSAFILYLFGWGWW